jgi:regulator of sirC expression with transglutaminase-like and TPR domain
VSRWTEHRNPARRRLATLLQRGEDFDVVEAALIVAAEEYTGLDVVRERRKLESIALEAGKRAARLSNPFARLDAVRAYLFDELSFRGNREQFDDPRNSYLNEVLARRAGIPLTLSLVFVEAARAAGFDAHGVALPGHFVVRAGFAGREILVDPFHDGRVITLEDCRDLVARSTGRSSLFRPDLVVPASPRTTLTRMLVNLKRIFLNREEYGRALSVVERLLLVAPEDPREIRDRGVLLAHLGRPGAAVADLESYLSVAPSAPDAEAVRGRLAWLLRKMSEAN